MEQIRDSYFASQSQQIYTTLRLHQCLSAVKSLLEPSPQLSLAPVIPHPKSGALIGPHLASRQHPSAQNPAAWLVKTPMMSISGGLRRSQIFLSVAVNMKIFGRHWETFLWALQLCKYWNISTETASGLKIKIWNGNEWNEIVGNFELTSSKFCTIHQLELEENAKWFLKWKGSSKMQRSFLW